jgi:hypothetical protein|tara:strand:- start:492 stop:629 length:138 start_codon:yes stop_codon:yes gene_type:complete
MGSGPVGSEALYLGPKLLNAPKVTTEVVGGEKIFVVIVQLPGERP